MLAYIFGESDELLYDKLIKAIQEQNTIEANKLIEKIKNPDLLNKPNNYGNTPLILAADKKLAEVCKKLIPKMSNEAINITDNRHHDSALRKAIWQDLNEVCQMLIPRMYSEIINIIDGRGNTLLILAAKKGMTTVCQLLISRMSDEIINHVNNDGDTAASVASKDTSFKEVYDLLQKKQENFIKITKQDVESSLQKMNSELESSFNTNKQLILNVLLEKIQKLGGDKADLQKIDKEIENIIKSNIIGKKLIDLEGHLDQIIANQCTINMNKDTSVLGADSTFE